MVRTASDQDRWGLRLVRCHWWRTQAGTRMQARYVLPNSENETEPRIHRTNAFICSRRRVMPRILVGHDELIT